MTFRVNDTCGAEEAVARALVCASENDGQYILGTGDYRPFDKNGFEVDRPWTARDGAWGSDCAGFVVWCYKLRRHRPGFAKGKPWHPDINDVDDDLNCNSMIEDAQGPRDLFEVVTGLPQPGDMLVYPTITITVSGARKTWIGHIAIVTHNHRAKEWSDAKPRYDLIDVAQCKGPNGRRPGVVLTNGAIWQNHDAKWPKPQHRTVVLRRRST